MPSKVVFAAKAMRPRVGHVNSFVSMRMFMSANRRDVTQVVMRSRHCVKKDAEAPFLSLIKTIIQGLRCISDFIHFSRACYQRFGSSMKALNRIRTFTVFPRFLTPLSPAPRSRLCHVAKN